MFTTATYLCVPALCLLAGLGLAFIPVAMRDRATRLFVYVVAPLQSQLRGPIGHVEDVRGAAKSSRRRCSAGRRGGLPAQ